MPAKKTVVLSCVTFETVKVVDPAVGYKADQVHLFHYLRADGKKVYREFYDEVVEQLSEKLPGAEIVEHAEDPVYSFQLMLRDILLVIGRIRKDELDSEILINASAGTSEFSAAAVIASMMFQNITAFTVGTKDYTVVSEEKIRDIYFSGGRPVGLTRSIREPRLLPSFEVRMPDENLVRGLRLYDAMRRDKQSVVAGNVIGRMKESGLWEYEGNSSSKKTSAKQKETMFYQRHFINAWADAGWIEKPSRRAKFDLTEEGRNVIDTFYVE